MHESHHDAWQRLHGLADLAKFDPRQPRAPKGSAGAGRWVAGTAVTGGRGIMRGSGGGGGGGAIRSADDAAQRLMATGQLTSPDTIRRAAKRIRMFGREGWLATASKHSILPDVTHDQVADRLDQLAETYDGMMAIRRAIDRPTGD